MDITSSDIKIRIVRKLVQWRKWGGAHTENILKGLPAHVRGGKATKIALQELEKDGWLLSAIKTGETHYSLNPRKTDEIRAFYEKYCKKE